LFRLKNRWKNIDAESKAMSFFIINQYCSKISPVNAELLNNKGLDPVVGNEIWFKYFSDTRIVPKWFWNKPVKNKFQDEFKELNEIDKKILMTYYKEDVLLYLNELELKTTNIQTGKIRKNSKISKVKDKYNSMF
jgi:hypothetical protein